jgi:hypothetical protein
VGSLVTPFHGHAANSEAEQDAEVDYLVDELARRNGGVKRLYYYGFWEPNDPASFDSGLMKRGQPAPANDRAKTRPAYFSYRARSRRNPFGQ